ncbi:hypothetical protein HHS34_001235 [Acidithiobacillus montserratensis]|uniref:Uncharacterized protein n=1 Tax=Acidithiobacillus montserratensis TaxID=2729135 RepID=A0ACD5HH36_9PROT|nr:hypothetical protein [Acidithiobacillus montserratensis]MBN2680263.1 hypothetical protein [Acidithiobacillaceae bacterium]MBU2746827.1 hypothetical protein [Acidithiobacillus montserratensis]
MLKKALFIVFCSMAVPLFQNAWADDASQCTVTAPGDTQQQFDRLMTALVHKDFNLWTEHADPQFATAASAQSFQEMASSLDQKLGLQKHWTANYVTTLNEGKYQSGIWRLSMANGQQVLIQITFAYNKVAGFHVL